MAESTPELAPLIVTAPRQVTATLPKTADIGTTDYLSVRTYLYKYTPPFTRIDKFGGPLSGTKSDIASENLGSFEVDYFSIPLDEQYLSRFDISEFVNSYTSTQSLNDGQISWSTTLADQIIPIAYLNPPNTAIPGNPKSNRRPIYFPDNHGNYGAPEIGISADELITNIAQYKTDATTDFVNDSLRIEIAMRLRGISDNQRKQDILTAITGLDLGSQLSILKNTSFIDINRDGILLSDLIQKYDFITTLVYSYPLISAQLIERALTTQTSVTNTQAVTGVTQPDVNFFDKEANFFAVTPVNKNNYPLYTPEFNGFVTDINSQITTGSLNSVSISGTGILTPFNNTRVVFTSGLFQNSIYGPLGAMNAGTVSPYTNLFTGKNPSQIIHSLLQNIYQINNSLPTTVPSVQVTPTPYYIDIDAIKSKGQYSGQLNTSTGQPQGVTQLFVIPSFLYAEVMRMRKFNVKVNGTISQDLVTSDGSGGEVLSESDFTSQFRSYFIFIGNGLSQYVPGLKTPAEVMKDVRDVSYLEFYETPGGRLTFRTPKYNDNSPLDQGGNMITSRDVFTISSRYDDTSRGLISQIQLTYGIDIAGQLFPFWTYTNGKLLSQYGLFKSNPQVNPNVKVNQTNYVQPTEASKNASQLEGIFQYCKFFLEYVNNMKLRTGRITAVGNPLIQVGRTYYDVQNQRFGYISRVTKNLTVGQTYTTTFDLEAVRDTIPSSAALPTIIPAFKAVPELKDIVVAFGDSITSDLVPANQTIISKAASARREFIKRAATSTITQKTQTKSNPSTVGQIQQIQRDFLGVI